MTDRAVARDIRIVADLTAIYCRGRHRDRERIPVTTEAAGLGVYGRRPPRLCEECAAHLRYAEQRRAACRQDPKPFCAYCDVHCYRPAERTWQRQMMRYSGPRSIVRGHAIQGIRHLVDGVVWRRRQARAGKHA